MYIDLFLDWSNDNGIRFYLSKQIPIQSINVKRIFSQTIKLMPLDRVVNDVKILCKGGFVLRNQSEHDVRNKLKKLVDALRKNHRRNKKQKTKMDKNPSRTKNIQMTPCGIRKTDALIVRKQSQRRKNNDRLTAPPFIPSNTKIPNEGISTLDETNIACLRHGGHNLNDYGWGVAGITDNEKSLRQGKYRMWCYRLMKQRKRMKLLNIVNIHQFDLIDRIKRNAIVAIVKFEHAMRNVTTCV